MSGVSKAEDEHRSDSYGNEKADSASITSKASGGDSDERVEVPRSIGLIGAISFIVGSIIGNNLHAIERLSHCHWIFQSLITNLRANSTTLLLGVK